MPAKKEPKMTRGQRAAMVIDRWAAMELELDRLRKQVFSTEEERMYMEKLLTEAKEQLEAAQMLVRVQGDTIARHVPAMVELGKKLAAAEALDDEHLVAIHELVEAKRKDHAADQAEIEYWMAEVNRLHYELIDIRREAARDETR